MSDKVKRKPYPFAAKARSLAELIGGSESDLPYIETALRAAFDAATDPPPPQATDAVCQMLRDLADQADAEGWRRDRLAKELRKLARAAAPAPGDGGRDGR